MPFRAAIRLGGVDCAAAYLHEPGDARDGLTVAVPLFVLNQVSDERTEWLVTGMLKDKIQALLKSLPQRPRSRLVPLPESRGAFRARSVGAGGVRTRLADGRCPQAGARYHEHRREAGRLQAGHAAGASVHERPHRRRARPATRHGPQPGSVEGGARGCRHAARSRRSRACRDRRLPRRSVPTGRGCSVERRRSGSEAAIPACPRRAQGQAGKRRALHRLDVRRAAGVDGSAQGRHAPDRISGADRCGRRRDDRSVRRTGGRGGRSTAPDCGACLRCS